MNKKQTNTTQKIAKLLDALTPAERAAIDVPALLAERGVVAVTWCLEDVLWLRPDLSHEQAWDVLEHCRDGVDEELGFTWTFIRETAACLYPQLNSPRPKVSKEEL